VPDIHKAEDYVAHHRHGLHTLARLMTLSFIDIDSKARTFRYYAVQVRGRARVGIARMGVSWGGCEGVVAGFWGAGFAS